MAKNQLASDINDSATDPVLERARRWFRILSAPGSVTLAILGGPKAVAIANQAAINDGPDSSAVLAEIRREVRDRGLRDLAEAVGDFPGFHK